MGNRPLLLEAMSLGGSDNVQTPPKALYPLLKYVPQSWVIWECAAGKGNLVRALSSRNYRVVATDILYAPDQDFLTMSPPEGVDCIITNPPYSIKDRFLERCYEIGKPFALLLPLTALGGKRRQALYREYRIQVVMLGGRVHFDTGTGKRACWFESAWFTWGLNLPQDIMFEQMQE